MKKTIAVLAGDGVGPEIIKEAVNILTAIAKKYHHEFIFKEALIGHTAIEKTGNPLPEETLAVCISSDAIVFGAIGDPKYDNDPTATIRPEQGLLKLRKSLGLFANLRPIQVYPELLASSPIKEDRIHNVDLLVIRELTGGIYFGQPRVRKDHGTTAIDTAIYTKTEIERVAHLAFQMAAKRKKHITSVDKANVLETSRLWRETVSNVAQQYPGVECRHMFVDNAAMQLIKNPAQFDVIVTENMFGDILTDEASVIAGSIGLLPSASLGKSHALYEPIHGAYNKAAGQNSANPIGTMLSCALMLRFSFQLETEAQAIENAVQQFLQDGYRTRDIATRDTPKEKILGTKEAGNQIIQHLSTSNA